MSARVIIFFLVFASGNGTLFEKLMALLTACCCDDGI